VPFDAARYKKDSLCPKIGYLLMDANAKKSKRSIVVIGVKSRQLSTFHFKRYKINELLA
jgi:hypothetical protein